MKEEELEFISVAQDDDNDLDNVYVDPSDSANSGSLGSGWFINQTKHPVTLFFHLLFKSLAIFLYMFGGWFTSNFVLIFVICIVLLAFDFWMVKNISGRLLVGLRWWSYVKEDGSNEWIFESLEDMTEISALDSRIFWGALYISPLCWLFLLLVGALRLKFEYMPIVVAALMLNFANIYGYYKCSSSARERVQSLVEQGMQKGSMAALENSSVRNWIFNTLLSVNTAPPPGKNSAGGPQ